MPCESVTQTVPRQAGIAREAAVISRRLSPYSPENRPVSILVVKSVRSLNHRLPVFPNPAANGCRRQTICKCIHNYPSYKIPSHTQIDARKRHKNARLSSGTCIGRLFRRLWKEQLFARAKFCKKIAVVSERSTDYRCNLYPKQP